MRDCRPNNPEASPRVPRNGGSKVARPSGIRTTNQRFSRSVSVPNPITVCRRWRVRRFDDGSDALFEWNAQKVNIDEPCFRWDYRDEWQGYAGSRVHVDRAGNTELISLPSFLPAGWVPSIHWGPPTIREVFLVHVVQPTSRQEALLQETREADESRRGTSVQGGVPGECFRLARTSFAVVGNAESFPATSGSSMTSSRFLSR